MNNKLLIILLLLTGFALFSQQGDDSSGEAVPLEVEAVPAQEEITSDELSDSDEPMAVTDSPEKPPEKVKSLFERTLELDIDTADYYQLIDWCRELGLQESGDVDQLRGRLKNHFKVNQEIKTNEKDEKDKKSPKKIVIKSADRLEYFTMSGIDEKYILLEGRVVLEIDESDEGKKSGNLYIIKANRLIMNQELRTLTAENDIEFTKIDPNSKDSEPEVLNGESFTYNLDTSVGIFYYSHGSSEQEVEKDRKEAFVYYGDTISRLENDVVILDQGRITSEVNMNDPNWQIKAAKIWVLTPDEWAVQDAVIYLGRIPVFYLPFFFYPGDEMFFNPVFGYRDREGEFLNTTTYIFGEKEKSNNNFSVFRIAQDSDEGYEKVIDGLFLKKVKTATPSKKYPENWLFKVMVDYYSRLGFFTGAKLNLDDFRLLGGIGFSRSLFPLGGSSSSYTPFYTENDKTSTIPNYSIVNGVSLPFRFGLESSFTVKLGVTQVKGIFDLFSDPYFPQDFYDRYENKEITEYLSSGSTSTTEDSTTTTSTTTDDSDKLDDSIRSELDWVLTSNLDIGQLIKLPSFVNTIKFPKFDFKFTWKKSEDIVNQDPVKAAVDPARYFFVPNQMIFPDTNMMIRGTLFKFSTAAGASKKADSPKEGEKFAGKGLIPPQETREEAVQKASEPSNEVLPEESPQSMLPEIKADQTLAKQSVLDSEVILEYNSSPYLNIKHPFDNPPQLQREDVAYHFDYSQLDTSVPLNLNLMINLLKFGKGSIVNFKNTLEVRNQYVTRFNRAEDYSLADWNADLLSDTYLNNLNLTNRVKLILEPLYFQSYWSSSKIDYSLDMALYSNFYETTTHIHKEEFFQWEEDYVTNHEVTALLNYKFSPLELSWTQEYDIPPRDFTLDETLTSKLTFGPSSTSVETGYIDEIEPYDFDPLNIKALTISEALSLPPVMQLNASIDYDFNESKWTQSESTLQFLKNGSTDYVFKEVLTADLEIPEVIEFDSSVSYMGLSLLLNFKKSFGYKFDTDDEEWNVDNSSENILRLDKIDLKYSWAPTEFKFWKNRISLKPNIITDWNINYQKFTENRFNFYLKLELKIFNFLDLTFTSKSYNNNTYRYFPGLAEKVNQAELRDNVLVDLLRSFNFFNIEDREQSNFKNSYFDFELTHYLDDWTFGFTYSGKYKEVDRQSVYSPEFTLSIKWSHIPQLKNIVSVTAADDQYDYDLWDQAEETSDTEKNQIR